MDLPFTRAQFFDVFAAYNVAVWPLQVALVALAIGCTMALWAHRRLNRGISGALAILWAWMAVAYHFAFFTTINPAAWFFGGLSLVGAGVFAWHAYAGTLRFDRPRFSNVPGLLLVAYALVGYPLVNVLTGHEYPRTPTFGLPCPTTIFTLGMLLVARRPVPAILFVVPFVWSALGTSAAVLLGVVSDFGLGGAALLTIAVLVARAARASRPRRRVTLKA